MTPQTNVKTKKCGEFTMDEMRAVANLLTLDFDPIVRKPVIDAKPEKIGTIYFVGAEDGPVKIGFTTNLETRLGRLQIGSPVKLMVLAAVHNRPRFDEGQYHRRFRFVRLHGEWFERTPEIKAEIERLSSSAPSLPGYGR